MSELFLHDLQVFRDERGSILPHKFLEREEQLDAYAFLPHDSTVLELGARYGTVSSIINRVIKDPRRHLVVEPDRNVEAALRRNREAGGSQYEIFIGAISKDPIVLQLDGYGSMTVKTDKGNVDTATIEELEKRYNLKFDALVADCEGCIESLINENDISDFRTIILEQDNACHCNYQNVESKLAEMGFVRVSHKLNIVYRSVYYNTKSLPFTLLKATGDLSVGLFGKLGYSTKLDGDHCSDVIVDEEGLFPISAHANSMVVIDAKRPLSVRGYCSPTAEKPPKITYMVDQQVIGSTTTAGEKTERCSLAPGRHELQVISSLDWAHSIWLLD